MKKLCFTVFLSAILAGIMIGIGGSVYLNLAANGDKVAGALLFSVGLFTIIIFKLHLYTGKVGYLPIPGESAKVKACTMIFTLLGNVVGTFALGFSFSGILCADTNVLAVASTKLAMPLVEAFLRAIPCGILMFVAVDGYKKAQSDATKAVIVLFSVAVFILAGFEHSVADMFYFATARAINLESGLFLLVVIIGNAVGGAGFSALTHYINKNTGGNQR